MQRTAVFRIIAATLPFAVFIAVYASRVGQGFILDDYRWVLESRLSSLSDVPRLFTESNGFYRPIVALSFGLNEVLSGIEPYWYGLTNVALALACSALVYGLARAFALPWGAAVFAASLWLLNFHGTSGAVLWISGRTSLIATGMATAAGILVARRSMVGGLGMTALAMLSKEEAVALPIVLTAWVYLQNRATGDRTRLLATWAIGAAIILSGYAYLRSASDAMTPFTAPSFYRYSMDPAVLTRNVFEYLDRAGSLSLLAALLSVFVLRPDPHGTHERRTRNVMWCGLTWLIGCFSLTILLPARSSLYVCLPSVGVCLIAADYVRGRWLLAGDAGRTNALRLAVLVAFAAAPIHYARSVRMVEQAKLSSVVASTLAQQLADVPAGSTIVIQDDAGSRNNVRNTLGNFLPEAVELVGGTRFHFWLESTEGDAEPPCRECIAARFVLQDGQLIVTPRQ